MPVAEKVATFDSLFGQALQPAPIVPSIVEQGEAVFSDWTVSLALRQWQPTPQSVAALLPQVSSASLLVRESALVVLQRLAELQPTLYQQYLAAHSTLKAFVMSHHAEPARIPAAERVSALKNTALFAETPENVLSSIVPIMKSASSTGASSWPPSARATFSGSWPCSTLSPVRPRPWPRVRLWLSASTRKTSTT
jgi:hypothetical protein